MTDTAYIDAVRESYDIVAAGYAASVKAPAELDPLSRALLAAFAELVRAAGRGPVADVGCGPGRVTAHLSELGLSVRGIDVSPKMIELARKAYPHLRFAVGSMTALEIDDHDLGGILAYYSTHHTPPELLPVVFAEFHRTLAPGGHLMLVCRVGKGEHLRRTLAYGDHAAPFDSYRLPAERICELLDEAGLVVTAQLAQALDQGAGGTVASFMARKPD